MKSLYVADFLPRSMPEAPFTSPPGNTTGVVSADLAGRKRSAPHPSTPELPRYCQNPQPEHI